MIRTNLFEIWKNWLNHKTSPWGQIGKIDLISNQLIGDLLKLIKEVLTPTMNKLWNSDDLFGFAEELLAIDMTCAHNKYRVRGSVDILCWITINCYYIGLFTNSENLFWQIDPWLPLQFWLLKRLPACSHTPGGYTCAEGVVIDAAGINVKVARLTMGNLPICLVLPPSWGGRMSWQTA